MDGLKRPCIGLAEEGGGHAPFFARMVYMPFHAFSKGPLALQPPTWLSAGLAPRAA